MSDIFEKWQKAQGAMPCRFCKRQPLLGPSAMKGGSVLTWAMECDQTDHMVSIYRDKKEDVIKAWNDGMNNKAVPC